jgi:hypothetical protein
LAHSVQTGVRISGPCASLRFVQQDAAAAAAATQDDDVGLQNRACRRKPTRPRQAPHTTLTRDRREHPMDETSNGSNSITSTHDGTDDTDLAACEDRVDSAAALAGAAVASKFGAFGGVATQEAVDAVGDAFCHWDGEALAPPDYLDAKLGYDPSNAAAPAFELPDVPDAGSSAPTDDLFGPSLQGDFPATDLWSDAVPSSADVGSAWDTPAGIDWDGAGMTGGDTAAWEADDFSADVGADACSEASDFG